MNKLQNKINWNAISFLGKSKFIKSFTIWIVIVPILAKTLHNTNNIKLFCVEFNLTLPFNLEVFYLCSLVFALANILYLIYCPDIIKEYKNPQDFLNKGGNTYILEKYKKIAGELKDKDTEELNIYINPDNNNYNRNMCEYFSEIENYFNNKYSNMRICITLLYVFGISLFIYILIENVMFIFI